MCVRACCFVFPFGGDALIHFWTNEASCRQRPTTIRVQSASFSSLFCSVNWPHRCPSAADRMKTERTRERKKRTRWSGEHGAGLSGLNLSRRSACAPSGGQAGKKNRPDAPVGSLRLPPRLTRRRSVAQVGEGGGLAGSGRQPLDEL